MEINIILNDFINIIHWKLKIICRIIFKDGNGKEEISNPIESRDQNLGNGQTLPISFKIIKLRNKF